MQALLEAGLPARDQRRHQQRAAARAGSEIARGFGVKTQSIHHRDFPDRAALRPRAGATPSRAHDPDLVVLAGFMRILTAAVSSRASQGRVINIHPSLLPAFQGSNTHRRALARGRARSTAAPCTSSRPSSTTARSSSRPPCRCCRTTPKRPWPLACWLEEHRILPQAVRWFLDGRLSWRATTCWSPASCRYPDPITSPLSA